MEDIPRLTAMEDIPRQRLEFSVQSARAPEGDLQDLTDGETPLPLSGSLLQVRLNMQGKFCRRLIGER